MKKLNCKEHGEVQAICNDSILLRYECPDCVLKELQANKLEKDNNCNTEDLND